ncbi:DUF11 domain-containing protein, partial [bacterium]|nr:DUF11 domain-containing protein [bacterium]
ANGQWLIRTLDADTEDAEMLQALGQVGGAPADIFAFVRNFGFEAYRGSLRGTRATLWSEAGNSLDQANLLIAMLRAAGVPARYRHGTLSQADAQTLIASMFRAPASIIGHVAPEIPVSDPVNDADLIAEAQDHWWVEAYINGAWTDLDPSFASALVGQRFTDQIAVDGTDRIAEVPDSARPKVTIRLDVELFNQLNVAGRPRVVSYLEHTFRVVEIATSPVHFSHYVDSNNSGGLVFVNTQHTYTPFLYVAQSDEIILGDPYQELLTNFPLATTFVTGAWLKFEVQDIDGAVTSYSRTLKDRLGYDVRTFGGSPSIALDGNSPSVFSEFDIYALLFFPGVVPAAAYERSRAALVAVVDELAVDTARLQALSAIATPTPAQQVETGQIRSRYQLNLSTFLTSVSMGFAEVADRAGALAQASFFVKAYHDDPRLVIISHEIVDNTPQMNIDLRTTLERTIAHPGQGEPATVSYNLFKGINESWLEGEVLGAASDAPALTTVAVMQAALAQDIDFVFVNDTNLDLLATIGLSEEAKARITAAALAGKIISLPTAAPIINGEPAIGWWEIDPATGETIGVMENGLHGALIEFFGTLLFGTTIGRLTDFMIGATAATWDFVGQRVFKALGVGEFGTPGKAILSLINQGLGCLLNETLGCTGIGKGYLDYGYMAMEAYLNYQSNYDPPLPDILIGSVPVTEPQTAATATVNVTGNIAPGPISADVQTDLTQIADADGGISFYAAAVDPLASGATGQKTPVNFGASSNQTLTTADLRLSPATGTLTVNGQNVATGAATALAQFNGAVTVTAAGAQDQAVISGAGDLFTLNVSPANSLISPLDAVAFNVEIAATFNDSFAITVLAPEGWVVDVNNTGAVTAQPPSGIAAGDYTIVTIAQSTQFPGLVLRADHTVTVGAFDGMTLSLTPDPLITVPMGPKLEDVGFINTGQAQVLGAAYLIQLTNSANAERTFTINVGGLPAGWTILGGERRTNMTLTLGPGQLGQIGLYVAPDSLPAQGTSYSISVSASSSSGQSANAGISFVMPDVPFSYVTVTPPSQAITHTATVNYDVTVRNVGNAAGTFGVTAEAYNVDNTVSFGAIPGPANIPAGGEATFTIPVSTVDAPTQRDVVLLFGSPVDGTIYEPTAVVKLLVVSAEAAAFLAAQNRCELPATFDAALRATALAVDELSFWCDQGDCPLVLRDRVVDAAENVRSFAASSAAPVTLPTLTVVDSAIDDLAVAVGDEAILAAVTALGATIYDLTGEACQVTAHRAHARFSPYTEAVLIGQTAGFSLDVTNQGTVTTTYAVTVTGLPGADLTFNEPLAPGETRTLPVDATPAALGIFDLTATVDPVVADLTVNLRREAQARLNAVDKFVQVTQVLADPPFVDSGGSATDLSVRVANIGGVLRTAVAGVVVTAPSGAVEFSQAEIPLTILGGSPRTYDLTNVDTSGWAEGVYTVTVDLRDAAGDVIPDGSGYGYLSVGQALQIEHSVSPEVVAPGTVTVTTYITSQIASAALPGNRALAMSTSIYDMPLWGIPADGVNGPVADLFLPIVSQSGQPNSTAEDVSAPRDNAGNGAQLTTRVSPSPAFTRLQQNDPAWSYTGTWSNVNLARASGGSHRRNSTASSTAQLTFDGTWISLGFIADRFSGYAAVTIDGVDYGVLDLYRNLETPTSFLFDGLTPGSHTLVITVQGSANPFASASRVQLDYADFGDGSLLPDGDFEQDDARVLKSNNWSNPNYAGASGGSYMQSSLATAWFPFAGDSFTLHSMAHSNGGKAQLFVDGVYLDTIDLFALVSSSAALSRTFSYNGLGSGPHILQIMSYQNLVTVDKLITPGSAPFVDPNPPVTGVTRFEADHPTIRYNGVPFTQTAFSWVRVADINANRAGAGEYIRSVTAGDTIDFDFEGDWLGIGFATDRLSGQAEIRIDGQLMQTVDLYSRFDDTAAFYFRNLSAGQHTVTVTVLGTARPEATGTRVHLDYFDVWDGQPLSTGTFEEDSERVILSSGWGRTLNAQASGGAFASSTANVTAWFPFTGDSFTYHGRTLYTYQDVELRLNGESLGQFNMYSYEDGFRTYSFDNLGDGPHMLEIRQYRGAATVDAVSAPAIGPAYTPPAPAPIVRYEEDHPSMRYNGQPYRTMPQNWALDGTPGWTSSGGNSVNTSTAGNIWRFDFDGEWVNIGLRTTVGSVDIRIDGVSQGTFDTSGGVNGVKNFPFALDPGPHIVEVEVISGTVAVDYMDVWQGQPMADGWYDALLEDEETGLFHFNHKQWWRQTADVYAYNGLYLNNFSSSFNNIWFHFVGTDLTILGNQRNGTSLRVVIDGVDYGVFDMSTPAPFRGQPHALHFPDLGEGPHVVQVFLPSTGSVTARIDAFEVDPDGFYSYMPQITWYDDTARESINPDWGTGFLSTVGIGDLNNDGVVELVAPARNGRLYVYRGDGQDTGNGTPILWTSDLVGPAAEPALADLTGDGLAEIIVTGFNGTFAFQHDGTLLWDETTVRSFRSNSVETFGWGGPTVGNLDDDPNPEIVISAFNNALYVLDNMGNILDSVLVPGDWPTVPVLADLTGDGTLEIISAQGHRLTTYEYDPVDGLSVLWTYTLTNTTTRSGSFGAPAVADLTGDGQPEIVINWGHRVEALRADGSLYWSYYTGNNNHFRPSPITVADVTGDGEINLITASAISAGFRIFNHTLMVLTADGNLVWEQAVADTTSSASGVAAQDLTGNGAWEILWNGSDDGFLILRGSDGKRLFNEPFTSSGTIMDYPTMGDVDGDGVADVVTAGRQGIFVISHLGRWVDSRPIWNQHNYHVTNINDDWSIPFTQPNNWELTNTYRTQTPDRTPAPSYSLAFTYTEDLANVDVLPDTASTPLTSTPPDYTWEYRQEWVQPVVTTTFASLISNLQPGEVRQISSGTEVSYRLPSGVNRLTLPPLYVTAARLAEMTPPTQSVVIGGSTVFTLTLTNPTDATESFSLTVGGVPAAWVTLPATVTVAAGESQDVPITVTVPADAEADVLPLLVDVAGSSGAEQSVQAALTVFAGVALAVTPPTQTAQPGVAVTYTVAITNAESMTHTYAITTDAIVSGLPATAQIGPGATALYTVTAAAQTGPQPFAVTAAAPSGATATASAILDVTTTAQAALRLSPDPLTVGPGSTGVFVLTVTNRSDTVESFDLDVDVPAGWDYELLRNGQPVNSVTLPPSIFNSIDLTLLLTPNVGAATGDYPVTARAIEQESAVEAASTTSTAAVTNHGVTIQFVGGPGSIDPRSGGTWNVQVTNTGQSPDSFSLGVAGPVATAASFSAPNVSLDAGASQVVQLQVGALGAVIPADFLLEVSATSQANSNIQDTDRTDFGVGEFEDLVVSWAEASRTVDGALTGEMVLVVENRGNVNRSYNMTVNAGEANAAVPVTPILIPAGSTAQVPVTVTAPRSGTYALEASVNSAGASSGAEAAITFVFDDAPVLVIEKTANPAVVNEGGAVTYTVVVRNEGQGPATDVTVTDDMTSTLAAGLTLAVGEAVTVTYGVTTDDGPQTMVNTAAVTSTQTALITDSVGVQVSNVAPTATLGNNGPVNNGGAASVSFGGQFDPSAADTAAGFRYSYDLDNDGVFDVTNVISPSVTVPATLLTDVSSRTVRARIADKDGGFNEYTTIIQVTAATATATATAIPPTATQTPTATATPVPPTATATQTPTATPVPPTATHTPTPTATATSIPPTATPMPTPTATATSIPPTATPMSTPIATATSIPPTATPMPTPTATATSIPPTATHTPTPTVTSTPIPPTATHTPTPTATPTADNPGGAGNPPSVTSPGNQENTVNDTVALAINAQDSDGDVLSFSAEGLPPGLSIDGASGLISGMPTTADDYAVTVRVSDDAETVSVSFAWRVLPPHGILLPQVLNNAPVGGSATAP